MRFVDVKHILSPRNGMNLYRGCSHGCIYCDSRSSRYGMEHVFEDIEVKTNAIGWVMMVANASVEIDLSRRFSINLPFYYSGLDYFTRRAKFRILATQPELRFWFAEKRRVFVGAHFGVASYNFALGGKWRIQDHNGTSPALGGGISARPEVTRVIREAVTRQFAAVPCTPMPAPEIVTCRYGNDANLLGALQFHLEYRGE